MKQIELKYTQLVGKALSYNVLASIHIKSSMETNPVEVVYDKKGRKGFKKIGSKKLYGSTLLVDRLMNY